MSHSLTLQRNKNNKKVTKLVNLGFISNFKVYK